MMHCCRQFLKFSITQRVVSCGISSTVWRITVLVYQYLLVNACRPQLLQNPREINHRGKIWQTCWPSHVTIQRDYMGRKHLHQNCMSSCSILLKPNFSFISQIFKFGLQKSTQHLYDLTSLYPLPQRNKHQTVTTQLLVRCEEAFGLLSDQ